MIINGFGGGLNNNDPNEGWFDIITMPISGTQTIPTFSCYSGSHSNAFHSPVELSCVWPQISNYRALRVKPNTLTFKTVSSWSGGGSYELGFYASNNPLTSRQTSSSNSNPTWQYCHFAVPSTVTSIPVGSNMATYSSSYLQCGMKTITFNGYGYYNNDSQSYPYPDQYAINVMDNQKYGGSYFWHGATYYWYVGFVWNSGGSSTDLSFSVSGSLVIQAHY